ncbi:hypothetical protein [Diaphorobacter sp.]|uniref:hypothetical protein n=1 Tax=Diaphorobacter sp. TaxID=1934310 RepID=UPI003D0F70B2
MPENHPTVSVIDLTASIGLHALAQLGAPAAPTQHHWPQILLGGNTAAPRIDWHRPRQPQDLGTVHPAPETVALLVGPGSLSMLRDVLTHRAIATTPAVWIFLLPSAVMENMAIQSAMQGAGLPALVLQLPDSAPQTLWFILMEQLGKLNLLAPTHPTPTETPHSMTSNLKEMMSTTMTIDGALAAALVDYRSGMCLAQAGGGMNLDLAAAGNSQVVQAKLKTIDSLGLRKGIEDILITLPDQYHLIRLIPNHPGLFLYLVLDKTRGNLALARYKLTDIERSLRV